MKLWKSAVVAAVLVGCLSAAGATNTVTMGAFNGISVTNVWSGATTNPVYEVWLYQPTNVANVYVTSYSSALLVQPSPYGSGIAVPGVTNVMATTWYGVTLSNTLKFAYPPKGYFRVKCTNAPPYTALFGVTCD